MYCIMAPNNYASAFRRRRHYVFGLSVRPSVRPKPEIPSFDLFMGPLVHPTNRNRFTACPSVSPSVRRGFRAFAGERMAGMTWNYTCWCILTIFRSDLFMAVVCWFFIILTLFWLSETGQIWGFRSFSGRMEEISWNFTCWCILTTYRTD